MRVLRQKVFNKVKPKMMHNKVITGETMLELCEAYTNAINAGSVPCIESAWTYLCKNECQRAYHDALELYNKRLQEIVNQDLSSLNDSHKELTQAAVKAFKDRALGEN